jgi:hypothetical protein
MAHTYCSSAIFITKTLGCIHAVGTAALQACVAVHCPSIEQLRSLRPDVCSNRLGNKVLTPQSAASNTSAHTKARAPVTALGNIFCKRLRSTRGYFLQELSGDSTCSARQQPDCDPQFVAAQRDTAAAVPQTAFHFAISFGTSVSCFCCKRTRMRQHCRTPATAGMTACTSSACLRPTGPGWRDPLPRCTTVCGREELVSQRQQQQQQKCYSCCCRWRPTKPVKGDQAIQDCIAVAAPLSCCGCAHRLKTGA